MEIKWWLETHGGHGATRLSRNQVFHLLQHLYPDAGVPPADVVDPLITCATNSRMFRFNQHHLRSFFPDLGSVHLGSDELFAVVTGYSMHLFASSTFAELEGGMVELRDLPRLMRRANAAFRGEEHEMDFVLDSLPTEASELHRASRFPRDEVTPILCVAATFAERLQSASRSQPSSRATSATSVIDSSSEGSREDEEAVNRWDDIQRHLERLWSRVTNGTRIQAHVRGRQAWQRVGALCAAATTIQAAARGWLCRNWLVLRHKAATKIACVVRRKHHMRLAQRRRAAAVTLTRVGRGRATRLWYRRELLRRHAATTITRVARGFCTRRRMYAMGESAARLAPRPTTGTGLRAFMPQRLGTTGRSLTWPGDSVRVTGRPLGVEPYAQGGEYRLARLATAEGRHLARRKSLVCVVS